MSLGTISRPVSSTSQLPPLRGPFCSWTGLSVSRKVTPAPPYTVPVVFENAGLVMELVFGLELLYARMLPKFDGSVISIDPADNSAPYSSMPPWLISEVATEKLEPALPDSMLSNLP